MVLRDWVHARSVDFCVEQLWQDFIPQKGSPNEWTNGPGLCVKQNWIVIRARKRPIGHWQPLTYSLTGNYPNLMKVTHSPTHARTRIRTRVTSLVGITNPCCYPESSTLWISENNARFMVSSLWLLQLEFERLVSRTCFDGFTMSKCA